MSDQNAATALTDEQLADLVTGLPLSGRVVRPWAFGVRALSGTWWAASGGVPREQRRIDKDFLGQVLVEARDAGRLRVEGEWACIDDSLDLPGTNRRSLTDIRAALPDFDWSVVPGYGEQTADPETRRAIGAERPAYEAACQVLHTGYDMGADGYGCAVTVRQDPLTGVSTVVDVVDIKPASQAPASVTVRAWRRSRPPTRLVDEQLADLVTGLPLAGGVIGAKSAGDIRQCWGDDSCAWGITFGGRYQYGVSYSNGGGTLYFDIAADADRQLLTWALEEARDEGRLRVYYGGRRGMRAELWWGLLGSHDRPLADLRAALPDFDWSVVPGYEPPLPRKPGRIVEARVWDAVDGCEGVLFVDLRDIGRACLGEVDLHFRPSQEVEYEGEPMPIGRAGMLALGWTPP